jgi:hypothetical protein
LPNIDNEYKKSRAIDELPQSAGGKTIMTTEPKFIPNEAVQINLDGNLKLKTRLVDCVGYLVKDAIGHMENDMPRMVKTPWSDKEMPFEEAAETRNSKSNFRTFNNWHCSNYRWKHYRDSKRRLYSGRRKSNIRIKGYKKAICDDFKYEYAI